MRVYFDTEFLDDARRPLHLISIGLVAEDGREYYAESLDFHDAMLTGAVSAPWLRANVLPSLMGPRKPPATIAREVEEFCLKGGRPEVWGYFPSYDWVLLCRLWGRMLDVPEGFPHRPNCVAQLADTLRVHTKPPNPGLYHHALHDARWTQAYHRHVLETVP